MLKVRLLKIRTNDYAQLLDSANLPDIESIDDLYIIMRAIGTMLKPYAGTFKDPNLLSTVLDESIKNWSVNDLESLQYLLNKEGFELILTKETGEDLEITSGQVKYLLIDSSVKDLGAIPYGITQVVDKKVAVDSMAVIDVIKSFMSEYNYFDKNKFIQNPITDLLDQLLETRKLLGTVNAYAINKLSLVLSRLNKRLLVMSIT